ncbi:general secretion pathway protein GspB [Massilia sp. R2A-15]|uniref:general secretion pathway protein GspB n=1 Tax=Massilia sp. R2A-15 TaxID=3064278 RepID=UPI0027356406|nr:general secretion pathway protein GspB [Massilia sp. R2A-15]WLI90128.1 general secretion pathway protein GspB [Massilia sp. R2A-15]
MSYILEALKKAQAERQVGSAPTLQAVPLGAPPARPSRNSRLPWLVAGGVVLALAAAVAVWRMQAPIVTRPAAVLVATPPPVAPAVAAPPALAVVPPSAPATKPEAAPKPEPVLKPAPALKPELALKPSPVAKPAAPAEEKLPFLRELPDAVRSTVPQVTFGGYMYSANPADRLLLVDKVLRHEGEEVAPGLVLEQLRAKAAVMNYKGYRYLVPY